MEKVCDRANLNQAYRRVRANHGAAGIDEMTVEELPKWDWETQRRTDPVASGRGVHAETRARGRNTQGGRRGATIGHPDGSGSPRPASDSANSGAIIDPTFSESSYGFRRGRSAHQALKKASEYVREGNWVVVDLDLEKFFDRVNHDILMSRLARRIEDKRLLKIIRKTSGSGDDEARGVCERHEGTPQGGPLSPLLANLLLDDLDRELEKRGHVFCRYADDCNVYVKSKAAGERVMNSIASFLEKKLKLCVNREKSAVAMPHERKFWDTVTARRKDRYSSSESGTGEG